MPFSLFSCSISFPSLLSGIYLFKLLWRGRFHFESCTSWTNLSSSKRHPSTVMRTSKRGSELNLLGWSMHISFWVMVIILSQVFLMWRGHEKIRFKYNQRVTCCQYHWLLPRRVTMCGKFPRCTVMHVLKFWSCLYSSIFDAMLFL